MEQTFQRKIYPGQIVAGFGIAGFGLAYLGLHLLLWNLLDFRMLIGDLLAICALAVGGMVAIKAFGFECLGCQTQLTSKTVPVPKVRRSDFEEAVADGAVDQIGDLIRDGYAGEEASRLAFEFWFCTRCLAVARMKALDGSVVPLAGSAARTLIEAVKARPPLEPESP